MEDLIAKLENADGPSRELDGYIAVALGWKHLELGKNLDKYKEEGSPWMDFGEGWLHPGETESYGDVNLRNKQQSYEDDKNGRWSPPPAYTASIDAAITVFDEEKALQLLVRVMNYLSMEEMFGKPITKWAVIRAFLIAALKATEAGKENGK